VVVVVWSPVLLLCPSPSLSSSSLSSLFHFILTPCAGAHGSGGLGGLSSLS
jgi:hypothetical protein